MDSCATRAIFLQLVAFITRIDPVVYLRVSFCERGLAYSHCRVIRQESIDKRSVAHTHACLLSAARSVNLAVRVGIELVSTPSTVRVEGSTRSDAAFSPARIPLLVNG